MTTPALHIKTDARATQAPPPLMRLRVWWSAHVLCAAASCITRGGGRGACVVWSMHRAAPHRRRAVAHWLRPLVFGTCGRPTPLPGTQHTPSTSARALHGGVVRAAHQRRCCYAPRDSTMARHRRLPALVLAALASACTLTPASTQQAYGSDGDARGGYGYGGLPTATATTASGCRVVVKAYVVSVNSSVPAKAPSADPAATSVRGRLEFDVRNLDGGAVQARACACAWVSCVGSGNRQHTCRPNPPPPIKPPRRRRGS